MTRMVVDIGVDDLCAAMATSTELLKLVAALGRGEVQDARAVRAAQGLAVSLSRRLTGMQRGAVRAADDQPGSPRAMRR